MTATEEELKEVRQLYADAVAKLGFVCASFGLHGDRTLDQLKMDIAVVKTERADELRQARQEGSKPQ